MKNIAKNVVKIMIGIVLCVIIVSCGEKVQVNIWESATYTENQEFGTGDTTITVDVIAEENSVQFTVNTDKETLGDALLEHSLISGDQGAYGLYVKTVNGVFADYNTTKSYWGINKNGESLMTGVDSAKIADGDSYEFVYNKN